MNDTSQDLHSEPLHVVIVDGGKYRQDDFAPERAAWESAGFRVTVASCDTEESIIDVARNADALVYMGLYTPITAAVLEALTRCRIVARYGIGMDSVDLTAATRLGIIVANAAEYCVPEVADHATALILGLARRIVFLDRYVREGNWSGATGFTGTVPRLSTQTLGLVGFGRIARRVARNLAPIVGTIVATDPYVKVETAEALGVELVQPDELYARADFISVHTPLLEETRGLLDASAFASMKSTAYVINTSRGPVIDESALIHALKNKSIAGAALDVFEQEPLQDDSPLRDPDNVILTPHFAAYSEQAIDDLRESVIRAVLDVLKGYMPPYVMNRGAQPRFPLQYRKNTQA